MKTIRRLQHIGNQYLLNVPASLAKEARWQRGDYFEIIRDSEMGLAIRKIAENDVPSTEVKLATLEQEASNLFTLINATSMNMNPGEFSGRLAQFSHIQAKMRKLRQKIYAQSQS